MFCCVFWVTHVEILFSGYIVMWTPVLLLRGYLKTFLSVAYYLLMLDLQNKLGNILTNAHAMLITFEIMPKSEKNISSYEVFYSLLPWMKKLSKKSYLYNQYSWSIIIILIIIIICLNIRNFTLMTVFPRSVSFAYY